MKNGQKSTFLPEELSNEILLCFLWLRRDDSYTKNLPNDHFLSFLATQQSPENLWVIIYRSMTQFLTGVDAPAACTCDDDAAKNYEDKTVQPGQALACQCKGFSATQAASKNLFVENSAKNKCVKCYTGTFVKLAITKARLSNYFLFLTGNIRTLIARKTFSDFRR